MNTNSPQIFVAQVSFDSKQREISTFKMPEAKTTKISALRWPHKN